MATELERIKNELNGIAAKLIELGLPWQPGMLTSDGLRLISVEPLENDEEECWYSSMWGDLPEVDRCPTSHLSPPDFFDDLTFAYVELWLRQKGLEFIGVTRQPTRLDEAKRLLKMVESLDD